ncbi:glycosyltransferase family 39 protein [Heliophilum fasciatum]|uniref:Dolichyl-phosphate-mannose-protein mannosyltransferase n=1 Tax=Heliophilum fasciatum TaxID=35700 RepID=A0A4R2RLL0_9FIRM|nr:glycosyltransferase family 39 protein [Heliophilum fasciatum]MCW2278349.1 4-amino-4-deoxy-L-arabinose transferase-like glycosyltransferase [Heliophilum fasciatum]TCP63778.1 dolichyl-phosphate-mannose-protein mannosyltransferase [Heliophilum fasciatum]
MLLPIHDRQERPIIVVLLIALILRLTVGFFQGPTLTLHSDDQAYLQCALRWLETGTMTFGSERPTAFVGPLFPGFLAVLLAVFGGDDSGVQAIRYVQVLMGTAIVYLTYRLGCAVADQRTALLAALVMALYPPNILVNGLILTETLFTLLLLGGLFLLVRIVEDDGFADLSFWLRWGIFGVYTALLALTRATAALYPILFVLYLWWVRRWTLRRCLQGAAVFALAFSLVMAPWWVRNYVQFDQVILFSSGAGEPLLMGTYVEMEGLDDPASLGWPAGTDEIDTQQKYKVLAMERLRTLVPEEPGRYLWWYTWGKFAAMWGHAFMWPPIWMAIYPYVEMVHLFLMAGAVLGIGWALVRLVRAPVPGRSGRDRIAGDPWSGAGQLQMPLLWLSLLGYYSVVYIAYFAFPRYHIPLLPIVFLFTAYAWVSLYDWMMDRP